MPTRPLHSNGMQTIWWSILSPCYRIRLNSGQVNLAGTVKRPIISLHSFVFWLDSNHTYISSNTLIVIARKSDLILLKLYCRHADQVPQFLIWQNYSIPSPLPRTPHHSPQPLFQLHSPPSLLLAHSYWGDCEEEQKRASSPLLHPPRLVTLLRSSTLQLSSNVATLTGYQLHDY